MGPRVRRWGATVATTAMLSTMLGTAVAAPARASTEKKVAPAPWVTGRPDSQSAMMAARKQGHQVEVLSERTETSQTFANSNGSWTSNQYPGPVRVKDATGGWHPIDTTLVKDAKGAWHPKWAAADLSISDGGTGAFASIEDGARAFSVSWPGNLPKPQVSGNTATYENVQPGVDLKITALPTGFSHVLVIRKAPTRPLKFALPTQSSGMELSRDTTGHLRLKNKAGHLVASAPAPAMWDSSVDRRSGESQHIATIPTEVKAGKRAGDSSLELSPATSFFATKGLTYPVIVDPATTLAVTTDTWVQTPDYPDSQISSSELKAGTYDAGSDVARSYLKFNVSKYAGKHIIDTDLQLHSYYSSTCATTGAGVQVRRITSNWDSSAITWGAQPATTTTDAITNTAALGYSSSCPAGNMHWDVDNIVKSWTSGASTNYGFQVRGASETDSMTWRRFRSANYVSGDDSVEPHLTVTYNSIPGTPTSTSASPLVTTTVNTIKSTSATPTFSAKSTDADGGNVTLTFEVSHDPAYTSEGTGVMWTGTKTVASGTTGSVTMPATVIGSTRPHIQWRVKSSDGTDTSTWSGYGKFMFNITPPGAPTVSCPDYTSGAWSSYTGSEVCTLDTTASDGAGYYWALDNANPTTKVADPNGTGGDPLTVTVKPASGWHTLYAKSFDDSYNQSTVTAYSFGVGTAGMTSPADQDTTSTSFTLQANSPPGPAKVTFQYRQGNSGSFVTIPAGDVKNGGSAVTWPIAVNTVTGGVQSPALSWSVTHTVADDGLLQIQAVFTDSAGSNPITTAPVNVTLDRLGTGVDFGATQAGPVTVGLQSGNASIRATDASIASFSSGLALTRTFNSLAPAASSLFGPGWTTTLPVLRTGVAWSSVSEATGYAVLTGADGSKLTFATGTTDGNGVTPYIPQGPAAARGLTLTKKAGVFTLNNSQGIVVTFTHPTGAASGSYLMSAVTRPGGGNNSTSYVYDSTSTDAAYGKPVLVIAPDANAPAGTPSTTACPSPPSASTWDVGCRALELIYDSTKNVSQINFVTSDGATLTRTAVAQYAYDASGRLIAQWDPRISPALKNTYTYNETVGDADFGRLTSISPAQSTAGTFAPWNLAYNTTAGSADYGKLLSVTRTHDLAHGSGTAKTAVVYSVPLTAAAGGPANMDAATTATWGQQDNPVSAVAVFPPDHAPSGTPPSDWTYATIMYYDANGREVNTATYNNGWNITTTEYDQYGNTVRELSAANRATGLAASDPATATGQLDIRNLFSADGSQLTDVYGPAHQASADGTLQTIRAHTHYTYDEGAPNNNTDANGQPYGLLTTVTVAASIGTDVPGSADTDARVTQNLYSIGTDTTGWTLHTPLQTVTDPGTGHLNIVKTTMYNEDSSLYGGQPLPIESRMPANSNGGGAGTTRTVYYTAGTNSADADCGNKPAWANLTCKTKPAAQPGTSGLASLPVTQYTYNLYLEPLTKTDTWTAADGSTATRTGNLSYDAAGRSIGTTLTTTGTGMGTGIPATKTLYDAASGLVTNGQNLDSGGAVSSELDTGYDDFGNVTSYTDASGNVSHFTYDVADRVITRDDGKGTATVTYNAGTNHTGTMTAEADSQAGTFSFTYDADGNIITQNYPGGTVGTYTYDSTGAATDLAYTNSNWAGSTLTDSIDVNAVGDWAARSTLNSDQTFSYDAADRLSAVTDTQAGQCTTRGYGYDVNSNRSSATTGAPAVDGSCQTGTTTTASSTYDAADRLTNAGYQYNTQGDTTTTPAADAGGTDLTATYYTNSMIATQTQDSRTLSWQLDPQGNRNASYTDSANGLTYTNHYATNADTPTWTSDSGGGWNRNVVTGTGLAGQVTPAGTVLELVSLHGDVMATVDPAAGSSVTGTFTYNEFGGTESGTPGTYGWQGGSQRSGQALGGQILMGARSYNTSTGRFSQVDSVFGGSANAYDYGNQNPLTGFDPAGTSTWGSCSSSTYYRTCSIYLSEYRTTMLIDALVWGATVAGACAAAGLLSIIGSVAGTVCGVISAVAYVAAATLDWIDDAGHNRGIYFRAYFYASWSWSSWSWHKHWHVYAGYVWHR